MMAISHRLRRLCFPSLFLLASLMLWGALTLAVQAQAAPSSEPGAHGAAAPAATPESHEAEDESAEFKHSASVQLVARWTGLSLEGAYWLCVLLNFAVIAAAVIWLSKKNLPGLFRGRTASIQKAMEEARRASEDANRRLSEIETRLARLDGEIGEMRGAADNEAVAEEARIQAAAAEEAQKIVQVAEQEIATAAKTARRELTAYAADLAVALARKQIQVNPAMDQALVRDFARQLAPGDGRKAGKEDV